MNTNTGESSALPLSTEGSRRALLQSLAVAGGAAVGALLPMDTVLARHTGVPHNSPETLLCVETIADLRAVDIAEIESAQAVPCVTVLGYYAPGDGGGGRFYWDGWATEPDNDGTVITPNSDLATGRWKRLVEGHLSVKWFGATGDGATNDAGAIQAAIDSIRGTITHVHASLNGGGTVYFPVGDYSINTPIDTYSGIRLEGDGPASRLVEGSDFVGTALIFLVAIPGSSSDRYQAGEVCNLEFMSKSTDVAAIRQATPQVLFSRFEKLYLNTVRGLILDSYTQDSVIDTIFNYGPTDQIIHLAGNDNIIQNITKEAFASVGESSDPYILISEHTFGVSANNYLKNLLLEGGGSPFKSYMILDHCATTVIDGFWAEMSPSDGYVLRIVDCGRIFIRGGIYPTAADTDKNPRKIKVDRTSEVILDTVNSSHAQAGTETSVWSNIEIDEVSHVRIHNAESRRGFNTYNIDALTRSTIGDNLITQIFWDQLDAPEGPSLGMSARNQLHYLAGQNLLINPSFEAGDYGWIYLSREPTLELVPSQVGQGLMAHFSQFKGSTLYLVQSVDITNELAGQPLTFTIVAKLEGKGLITPYFFGAGMAHSTQYNRISAGSGWHVLTQTFIPPDAGSMDIGVLVAGGDGSTEVWLDDASLGFGTIGAPNLGKFASMELGPSGGNTVTFGALAPENGTWKVGDIVFNSNPIAGGNVGWVCVTPGGPGTWKGFGGIAI